MKQMKNYKTGKKIALLVSSSAHFLIFDEYVAPWKMLGTKRKHRSYE